MWHSVTRIASSILLLALVAATTQAAPPAHANNDKAFERLFVVFDVHLAMLVLRHGVCSEI